MAIEYTEIMSEKDYSDELKESNVIDVPDKASKIIIRAKRNSWYDYKKTSIIKVNAGLSLDGGVTWTYPFIGFGASGGNIKKDESIEDVFTEYSFAQRALLPGKNRKAKVVVEIDKDVVLNTFVDIGFE